MTSLDDAREQLVELGRALYNRGVTPVRTGNLSVRAGDRVLMTPTGVSLGRLVELSVLDADGHHLAGPQPSKGWALHRALYARDETTRAVAHVHSTHAVAVSMLAAVDAVDAVEEIEETAKLQLLLHDRDITALTADQAAATTRTR